jgi:hypothetical protein
VAIITSPFFDEGEPNRPASEIWNIVNRRGKAEVVYQVLAEEIPGTKEILLHAPETLRSAKPANRHGAEVCFSRIKEIEEGEEGKGFIRPLHLKSIWLESDKYAAYVVGSSNFTSAGTGLGPAANVEANIAYSINHARNPKSYRMLEAGHVQGEALEDDKKWRWIGAPAGAEDAGADEVVLPAAFESAVYGLNKDHKGIVLIKIVGSPPDGWIVKYEDSAVYDETRWMEAGRPSSINLGWGDRKPPSGFEVIWKAAPKPAWWPVNVAEMNALPPPEDLKDLPLEVLIDILTSARPLHQVIRRWLKKRGKKSDIEPGPLINPHDRVDTSSFLLQRTRRISFALYALRSRLERPAPTKESLDWRLSGPIGVSALAKAIMKEAKSDEERAFILTELALELSRVKPKEIRGSLSKSQVKRGIVKVIKELRDTILKYPVEGNENLKRYIRSVMDEICP